MPDGLLQWYDDRRGEGRVVRGGRRYPVRAEDMEPHARVPGARVHFDVTRRGSGAVATNVSLREGTRVSRRQRRFGDMTGARAPDTRGTAPFATPHPELGHGLATRPEAVVQRWADLVAENDIESAVLLYAPDVVVHAGQEPLRGRHVHAWLAASGLLGHLRSIETSGAGGLVELRWLGPDERPARSWARVAHGEIAEQWLAGARPRASREPGAGTTPPREPTVEVVALSADAEEARDYAERKIRRVIDAIDEPVLFARAKLTVAPDPAVERPARAQVTLDIDGQLVRAQVTAHGVREAVDLLEQRLRDRLDHRAEHQKALRHLAQGETPGEWRHAQPPTERPGWFDRPADEREIISRKTFALDEQTVDEAALDMEVLDLDFYLFRELATGGDAVLYRLPGDRYGLRRLDESDVDALAAVVDVTLDARSAPTLAVDQAVEWLGTTHEPFVFFRDGESGHARLVYRRYDGHYGLIVPADEPASPAAPSTARRRLRDELARLEGVRTALVAEALDQESESESVAEMASIDQHQADLATETFERERDLSLREDVEAEIADVRRALARVDAGTYGLCEACGIQIPDERLQAMPATRFCLEHQAATEVIRGRET